MDYRGKAVLIHSARAVYAVNWMDIAPALIYIKSYMNLTSVQLGLVVTSFYIGISIFQLLGGYLSSFIGDKQTSLIGLLFVGIFAITSGLSTNFLEISISRFLAGMSAALFFSPALSLLASIVPSEKYSFHIGVYNGAFNIGAGTGVIGWAILDIYIGYRYAFLIAGIITVMLFLVLYILFKNIPNIKTERSNIKKSLLQVFSSKMIIFIAFIGIGSMISETIMGQFFVYYLESLSFSHITASTLASIYLLIGFFGGVLGGYHFSRTDHKIRVFLLLNILIAALLAITAFIFNYIEILIVVIAMGMSTVYGISVTYTFVRYMARRDLISLSLSFVNFVQLLVAAVIPVIFTIVYTAYNYKLAWIAMAILSVLFIPLILTINKKLEEIIKIKTSV
ncbi:MULTISPECIES: MFS transporter [Acidiplasma]|jgi:MFS family permease|uniref:Resistance protein NorA n=3 Tax=Acidiplasma TaxID=507753 RepID=A0A0Q0RLF0_9ARCH|nr:MULTISPECIES: MFS transporter [Acidiplasma]KPV46217.1 resistance protein NorA [Acidiplasma aeolicum]KQB35195.1 resistance protein NorA [Acidiplasma aeolicum]KQB36389.1 resistance protein NorA [Acidiplasma cupricumulans]WMT54332.1 MAG: MFS transporter [Acidiplasma sp.]